MLSNLSVGEGIITDLTACAVVIVGRRLLTGCPCRKMYGLGIVVFLGLHLLLIFFLMPTPFGFVVILPLVYALAVTAFMGTYAAYPIIDKYLIAPYASEEDTEEFIYLKPDEDDSQS